MSDNRPKLAWRDPDGLHPIAIRICEDSGGVPEADARELLDDLASALKCEVRVKHEYEPFDPDKAYPSQEYWVAERGATHATPVVLDTDGGWYHGDFEHCVDEWWYVDDMERCELFIKARIPERGPE